MNKASLFLSVAVSLAVVFTVYAYASRTCTAESVTNDRIRLRRHNLQPYR